MVTPSLGVNNFNEFVAYARSNPGKINFSTYSGASQLAYAQIVKNAGVDMLRVPYKGEAPSVTDILGGTIHAVFATPTSSFSHIRDGRLKALAVDAAAALAAAAGSADHGRGRHAADQRRILRRDVRAGRNAAGDRARASARS